MTGPKASSRWPGRVAPVDRPALEARHTYDLLAPIYDFTEAPFERRARAAGLRLLDARPGERVLEVGFGTGACLAALQRQVPPGGAAIGVDLSGRMAQVTRRRFARRGLGAPGLMQADARNLPLAPARFDAVSMSFFLELIATPDIPVVLGECRRVLRPGGRLVVVCLDLHERANLPTRLYLAAHRCWPRLVDCRPLPVAEVLAECGFRPMRAWSGTILGLAVTGVAAAS